MISREIYIMEVCLLYGITKFLNFIYFNVSNAPIVGSVLVLTSYVENLLSQNCNVFSVPSIFK